MRLDFEIILRSLVSRRTQPNPLKLCPQKPGILVLKLHTL